MFKKIGLTLLVILVALIAVVATKTIQNTKPEAKETNIALAKIDAQSVAHRLSQAVQIKTISKSVDAPAAAAEFDKLHSLIDSSYPRVAKSLEKTVIGTHSLLYTWKGSDKSLPPVMLMGHMDVVPVEPGTEDKWEHPPYSGAIVDGAIWGRGTLDDKLSVFAILEAAEYQLANGFMPKRTLYLAFGHDEELGGAKGAGAIAAHLKKKNVKLAFTIDEGMVIVQGIMPGIDDPIAFIALAEKGFLTLNLDAKAEGGHSSIPPRATAVGKISKAIARLEENRLPASLVAPVTEMFDTLAPYMPLSLKAVISNRWLLNPILVGELGKGGATNAMVRTTTAATIINGGVKPNVLPSTASATVNFRILPGSSINEVVAHVKATIDDPDVSVSIHQGNEPSKVSSSASENYTVIETTIRETIKDVIISPGLMLAGSDTKHYESMSEDNYRFIPMRLGPNDLSRIHGTNERIMVENYKEIIQFYSRLMENAGS